MLCTVTVTTVVLKSILLSTFTVFGQAVTIRSKLGQKECQPLWLSPDSDTPVCVCNATYCDTIPPVQPLPTPQYVSYTSSRGGLRFKRETASFIKNSTINAIITINDKKTYQTIIGWGGAFTDAAGININSLTDGAKANLMKSYFSEDGLEYNLGRVPIAGCDFSTHLYSYDDGNKDIKLKNFKLVKEDFIDKIPLIKYAQSFSNKPLELLGSAWVAPNWMQTNDNKEFGYIKESLYQVWANYYIKFLEAYKKEKIHFWAITTGNEPLLMSLMPFSNPFVGWHPENMGSWVKKNLGPTLRKSKFSKVKILTLDDSRPYLATFLNTVNYSLPTLNIKRDEHKYRAFKQFITPPPSLQVLSQKSVKQYIDGIAVHWYLDATTSPSLLNNTHNKYPNKFILGTEASILQVDIGNWTNAEAYAHDIIQDLNYWVTGWIDWNLALNMDGGPNFLKNFVNSAILVNAKKEQFYKQPMFYALGHFSKFIPSGSVRVDLKRSSTDLESVAFRRPDGGTAVGILNGQDEEVQLVLNDAKQGIIVRQIEARSIITILYW